MQALSGERGRRDTDKHSYITYQQGGEAMDIEVVNYIKTEKGYVEQSEMDEKELKEFAEKASDKFMSHFNYERVDKTA